MRDAIRAPRHQRDGDIATGRVLPEGLAPPGCSAKFANAGFSNARQAATGRYRAVATFRSRRSVAVSLALPSASGDDCCHPILNFSTNSANGSYQGTPAARPENRQGRVRVVHARSSQGAGRPLSLALLSFTHRRQLCVRQRTLGQIASMPATGQLETFGSDAQIPRKQSPADGRETALQGIL
jgi:hypothetical protein